MPPADEPGSITAGMSDGAARLGAAGAERGSGPAEPHQASVLRVA